VIRENFHEESSGGVSSFVHHDDKLITNSRQMLKTAKIREIFEMGIYLLSIHRVVACISNDARWLMSLLFCGLVWMLSLCLPSRLVSQHVQDSLRAVIARPTIDTNTVKALNDLAQILHETFPDTTRILALRAWRTADSLKYSKEKARSVNIVGISYFIQNNYEKALEYYLQALALREKIGDMNGLAGTLNNVGMVYRDMRNYATALSYYFRAVRLNDSLANRQFLARNFNNIGTVYEDLSDYDSALVYHESSLALKAQLQDYSGTATSLRNIGRVYLRLRRLDEAMAKLGQALAIPQISKQTKAQVFLDMSEAAAAQKKTGEAERYAESALELARELQSALLQEQAHQVLAAYNEARGNYRGSLEHYRQFILLRDSLFNEQRTKRLAALQTNYEIERQRSQIELLTKDKMLQETVRNASFVGLALMSVLVVVAFVAYRNKLRSEQHLQEVNAEIVRQQELLTEQAQEIEIVNTALSENNIKLSAINEELAALSAEKDEILGIAAHDLKNPLNSIQGMADMMLQFGDDMKAEQKRQFLTSIVQSSERMFELIKNILDVNALERGGRTLHPVAFHATPRVEWAIESHRTDAERKHLMIDLVLPSVGHEPVVFADEMAFDQIMDNLISNAVKYSPPYKRVAVTIGADADVVRVAVADEGPGLSADDQTKLFGKFARLSAQPTAGEHSTGLGLSIVKKLVGAMHGRVWCESELGKGATFIVELPIGAAPANSSFMS
jgi:signal transduction histidine kinase